MTAPALVAAVIVLVPIRIRVGVGVGIRVGVLVVDGNGVGDRSAVILVRIRNIRHEAVGAKGHDRSAAAAATARGHNLFADSAGHFAAVPIGFNRRRIDGGTAGIGLSICGRRRGQVHGVAGANLPASYRRAGGGGVGRWSISILRRWVGLRRRIDGLAAGPRARLGIDIATLSTIDDALWGHLSLGINTPTRRSQ